MAKYFFDVVINKEKLSTGKPIFVAHCTTLGVASQGKDVDEALKNIKEAVELYLEEMPEKLKELEEPESPPTFSLIEVTTDDKTACVVR